jgi:phage N-6-adenine-methyltransferase
VKTATKFQAWRTPPLLFQGLHADFAFTIDAAADAENAKCAAFVDEKTDAFEYDFAGQRVFCNPPFGRIGPFLDLGRWWAHWRGVPWTFLVPANIETRWFLDHAIHGEKHSFNRRIKYEAPPDVKVSQPSFATVLIHFPAKTLAPSLGFTALRDGTTGEVIWRP